MLLFLTELFNKGVGISGINTARSALSAILPLCDGRPVGDHYLVGRFLKGVKVNRPSLPRYQCTWDPNLVLSFLRGAQNESRKELTLSLTMLIALVTGQRAQTIHALKISEMELEDNVVSFVISTPLKTRQPGSVIQLTPFEEEKLCVVTLLHQYLAATKSVRKDDNLLISYVKPYRAVTCDTIRRWILGVMTSAGVNTSIFKAHSTRSASASAASRNKVPIAAIMRAGMWRSENTFSKFYNRPVEKLDNSFAEAVLRS